MNRFAAPIIHCCSLIIFASAGCAKDTNDAGALQPGADEVGSVASAIADKPIDPIKLREDLDYLFATIEQAHPNMYAYVSQSEFAKIQRDAYASITGPMTKQQFFRLAAPVIASLKNGHTFVSPLGEEFVEHLRTGGRCFPLKLYAAKSGFILQSYPSEGVPNPEYQR
jgi:hypothetical protein